MVENEEKQQEDQAISNNSYVYGDMSLLKNMSYWSSKLKTTTVSSWHAQKRCENSDTASLSIGLTLNAVSFH